jgi:hypothetical protein
MKDKLLIVWTSDNIEVAKKMVLLYGSVILPREYWSEAHIMVWGPSAKLIAQNSEIQSMVKDCMASGVRFSVCVVCSDDYGVTDTLVELGIEATHTGVELTTSLKDDSWSVITF